MGIRHDYCKFKLTICQLSRSRRLKEVFCPAHEMRQRHSRQGAYNGALKIQTDLAFIGAGWGFERLISVSSSILNRVPLPPTRVRPRCALALFRVLNGPFIQSSPFKFQRYVPNGTQEAYCHKILNADF